LEDPAQPFEDKDVDYFHFPISYWGVVPGAKTEEGVAKMCAPMLGWVSEKLEQGHSVLVHCLFGAHRAGTTGIACLMHLIDMDATAATNEARSRRRVINPSVFDFPDFLNRLQVAHGKGLVSHAIEDAAAVGYANAMAKVVSAAISVQQ
jgi:hypothetical protein